MPIEQVIKLVGSLQLNSESIQYLENGVERALKKYIQDGTEAKGKKCPNCGNETLVYQEGWSDLYHLWCFQMRVNIGRMLINI